MKKKYLIISTICLLLSGGIGAQVTIGSGTKPQPGALLDLKDGGSYGNTGATAVKGLGMPRVKLESLAKLKMGDNEILDGTTGEYAKHIGLIVYNTHPKEESDHLCPGLHVWDGAKWQPLQAYPDWLSEAPTITAGPTTTVIRTPINDPTKPVGHIGYIEDIRGPVNDGEYNRYSYARFYNDKVEIKTTTSYTGQKPFACVAENSTWTEITETETLDEGIFMTQNMNTKYFPDNTVINGGVPSATTVATDAQFSYPSSTGAITKTAYWDKSQGLLYNYKATVNKDVGDIDEEATAHEARQGICPSRWHVPSDTEYTDLIATLGGATVAGKLIKSATRLAGTALDTDGTSASADMGGFNLLLVGNVYAGSALYYGASGMLWCSSSSDSDLAWSRNMGIHAGVYRNPVDRNDLFSVRCKKD